ncbi:hypothetical protein FOL47_008511 [Perkinsus chesapeaki]|uniref:Uncharacterized protein n=1 Tax=Perkinsus chesapeaki TaxID=330153 RepID=A0A7J6MTK5_PERCH|nr:hypothetical protein FOL47_008511 [Perkinsus chesapeaki]
MSSESASKKICALQEEVEQSKKELLMKEDVITSLEKDGKSLEDANDVLGRRIADLEQELKTNLNARQSNKEHFASSKQRSVRNVATETLGRDTSSLRTARDLVDLTGLPLNQRSAQAFTEDTVSRAPTDLGDPRDLWTASAPRSPHSFGGVLNSPSYGGAMKVRADLVSPSDTPGAITVKLSSSSSAEAISPRGSTLCMLVEALRQEIHRSNAKHLILVSEIALSASHLSTVSEERDIAVNEARALRAALEEVEVELSTTKMSYDEQLGALTDHLCQMQQLVEEKEGLVNQTLDHRIYCGRCGCWNQLKSLVTVAYWMLSAFVWFAVHTAAVTAFQCFSEYEFSWHDPSGNLHINLFSVSHYQMKLWSFFTEQTPRPPLLEAYFVAKLNPQFKTQFEEECPATLVMSHALIALDMASIGDFDKAAAHFDYAMHYYDGATPVHQHIILHAWPLNISSIQLARAMDLRDGPADRGGVDFIVHLGHGTDVIGDFISHLQRYINPGSRILFGGQRVSETKNSLDGFAESSVVEAEHYCETYVQGLSEWNDTGKPKILLNAAEAFSLPLIVKVLQTDQRYLPAFIALGKTQRVKSTLMATDSTVGSSLLLKQVPSFSSIGTMRDICLTNPEALARRLPEILGIIDAEERSLSWKVPVGLRLKGGNEHWRFDWRDVLFAPVVPRRPIVQID